ncbi:MAG: hydantoinase/oxoprolinase family protein [Alphaproteobacteria bacterium]|nr:hydantoinase/oxoprolinase family protein [Alphaproteobacteria bacterium]
MVWFVGVDVGGTFTDFYAFDAERGLEHVYKTPSTPADPADAILNGLDSLCEIAAIASDDISRFAHGTTVATNALLQRKGAPVALITTEGFRDLLEIGRQIRPKLYDFKADNPPPLVPRQNRFEIKERVGSRGEVVVPLEESTIAEAIDAVKQSGAEACAVGLLFAFLNPEHERRIGSALREALPDVFVSLSSSVQPEFREFERLSTTALNAYLQPIVTRYMDRLKDGLQPRAPNAAVGINQSSGGLMSIERAGEFPVRTALSGPAAGAVGAMHTAAQAGRQNIITLDMGGTSADVCLVRDGAAGIGYDQKIADFPVRLPMVDVNTVGAGGGSIAWFDRDGLMKVGPISAGAVPGPACYGQGGTEPTVSDANLVLGRLSPAGLLGGAMALDQKAAHAAFEPAAAQLGFSVEKAAHGVLGIVVSNMVRAIRAISVERGHDPREFSLMAFGGAGPLHAIDVAHALDMREVIVPASPGILCAQGLVVSDLKEDFVVSARIVADMPGMAETSRHVATLMAEAENWFAEEDVAPDRRDLQLSFDMRYVGQNYELNVLLDGVVDTSSAPIAFDCEDLKQRFFTAHEMNYGYFNPDDAVEIVNFRLTARGRLPRPTLTETEMTQRAPDPVGSRTVYFDGDAAVDAALFDRTQLLPGQEIAGPAVIDQLDSTTLVYPGDRARVDRAHNLIIELADAT